MRYISTRGAWADAPQPFSAILLEGLAPDGGLAVPQAYPRLTDAEQVALRRVPYPDLAFAVLSRYCTDIPPDDLKSIIDRTYTKATFGSDAITPVTTLEPGLHLLHVSNGPTLAFKDIALQLLGNLFEYTLAKSGRTLNILGATSGDTGSSAEYAMRGKRGIDVFMLSPKDRMSPFQQAQMFSLAGRQHPQRRDRRRVRRMPGHRQGRVFRCCVQSSLPDRHGQFDQLGARRRPGRLLFQRLFRRGEGARRAGRLRRAHRQFRQHPRRTRRARDGTAHPSADPRDQRKRRARRVLPHRALSAAPGRRDARDLQSVDGHLQGVELRAVRVRHGRPRSCRHAEAVGLHRPRGRIRACRRAALGSCRRIRLRFGGQHARRSYRDDPPHAFKTSDRRRSAHRRRAQGRTRTARPAGAARVHRDGAAGQIQRNDQGSARARAQTPRRPTRTSKAGRSVVPCCPSRSIG